MSVVSAVEVTLVRPVQAASARDSVLSVTPLTRIEPFISRELRDFLRPAWIVSLPLSAEKIPVDRTVNANTEATTTNAIRIMAVSSPVTPRWSLAKFRTDVLVLSEILIDGFTTNSSCL